MFQVSLFWTFRIGINKTKRHVVTYGERKYGPSVDRQIPILPLGFASPFFLGFFLGSFGPLPSNIKVDFFEWVVQRQEAFNRPSGAGIAVG